MDSKCFDIKHCRKCSEAGDKFPGHGTWYQTNLYIDPSVLIFKNMETGRCQVLNITTTWNSQCLIRSVCEGGCQRPGPWEYGLIHRYKGNNVGVKQGTLSHVGQWWKVDGGGVQGVLQYMTSMTANITCWVSQSSPSVGLHTDLNSVWKGETFLWEWQNLYATSSHMDMHYTISKIYKGRIWKPIVKSH